jgi:hypothetical protein
MVPFLINAGGGIQLQPHRVVLIVLMPLLLSRLFSGRAGPLTSIDFLMFFAAAWASCSHYYLAFPIWDASGEIIDENPVVQPCFRTQSCAQGGVRAC